MNAFDNLINIDVKKDMGISGLTDEFFCVFLNYLNKVKGKNIIVVVNTLYEANKIYNSLQLYNDRSYLFPMDDFLTCEALAASSDLQYNRIATLNSILEKKSIVITNLMGYLRFLPNKEVYINSFIKINTNMNYGKDKLISDLINCGYSRDTFVNKTGEFAVRGYVVDVFPIDEDMPIRIEFFDDEIESIRYFDADSQRSLKNIDKLIIKPCSEFITFKDVMNNENNNQKYLPNYENVVNINSYLEDSITIFKDYDQLKVGYGQIMNDVMMYKNTKDVDFSGNYMFDFDDIVPEFCIYYDSINNILDSNSVNFNVGTISNFNENVDSINKFIRSQLENKKTVVICLKDYQVFSIKKKLNMSVYDTDICNIKEFAVNIVNYPINSGFIYGNYVFLSSSELFTYQEKQKKYNTKFKYCSSITDINKLNIGDYVVHNIHGIGVYNGVKTLSNGNIVKDYIEVLYQGSDKLYIPVEKIDLLSKYSGKEGFVPKVNKLGGSEWIKTKNRIKKRVSDMADKLLALYAERESRKGYAFSKDCDMLTDFESEFPYELTKDQIRSISQIKEDMEKDTPMDRLLCGDVGFGKTEVAFVAAFKAILDSKQVLFLCPTTILSSQHYENALQRFKNYPVSIALLNRFTSSKRVKEIVAGLSNGTIDLVFGTHRLLSSDIVPKDLGLLIIDEEQRFGVTHKEKIKQYKTNVDVLTLTATPIPRTLQMSLVGIRSLSLIETPPVNRYPVQTYVIEENQQILKDAIYKELSRNGQIFILYNKVQSIEEERNRIKNIAPEASIAIAHGQMTKNELEKTIMDFVDYKYDILICTTIIETGIDIPNVNTLIIIDADRFGLSQLYQIRGRVGRGDKFAYAYLMYNPQKILTETAVKRLNVIKEFTALGSGFSIATRDLSIRGAGDILGSEQAGFIDSVGINLYLKLLEDEVRKRKNLPVLMDDLEESSPLLNVSTHISSDYVDEDDLKIEIHRLVNNIDSRESLIEIKSEIEDRFGKITDDIDIYMYEEWFEKLAHKLDIKHVNQKKNFVEIVIPESVFKQFNIDDIFVESFKITSMFRFVSRGSNLVIVLDTIKLDKHPVYYLVDLLELILKKIK